MLISEKELLALMIAAPATEIDGMTPSLSSELEALLGIKAAEYDYKKHYHIVLAKMRMKWAGAMIDAAMGVQRS